MSREVDKMKILVTGGAGFIGSHLIEALLKLDYEVVSLDNYTTGKRENEYEGCLYINHDISTLGHLWLGEEEIDIIFHLAALPRIQYSIKNPQNVLFNNYQANLNIIEYARLSNTKLVYAASSSYWGGPSQSPYALSKWHGENLCGLYSSLYNLPVVKARLYNVYGPRQVEEGDFATVIGIFQKCKREGLPLPVVGDGSQSRDFTHVYDTIRALTSLLKPDIPFNGTYEIGTGNAHSIIGLAKMFNCEIEFIDKREGEYPSSLAKTERAENELGWKAKIPLRDYIQYEHRVKRYT